MALVLLATRPAPLKVEHGLDFYLAEPWTPGGDMSAGRDAYGFAVSAKNVGEDIDESRFLVEAARDKAVHYTHDYFTPALEDPASGRPDGETQQPSGTSRPQKDIVSLPPCTRTLLIDWGSFTDGFGSSYFVMLHAAYFAEKQGFTLLVSRDSNNYGKFLDYFMEPPKTCTPTEEQYSIERCHADAECNTIVHSFPRSDRNEQVLRNRLYITHSECVLYSHPDGCVIC